MFKTSKLPHHILYVQELGLTCPEDLFDIEAFTDDPRPFFKFAHTLYPGLIEPGDSHKFLAYLDEQNMLLRVYTQNIDALEQSAGVSKERVVYAHGSLSNATCMKCKATYSASDIANDVQTGTVPLCQRPRNKKAKISSSANEGGSASNPQLKQRRTSLRRISSSSSTKSDNYDRSLCCGVIKPNVTFFGEKLNNDVGRKLQKDYEKADALIVMGTSLSVAPMSKVVEYLRPDIPRILINRNIVRVATKSSKGDGDCLFNACLLGNCDDVVNALSQKMKGNNDSQSPKPGLVMNDDESWLHNQPKESVLLFPGAICSSSNNPEDEEMKQKIVVHCDECQAEIVGKIHSCKVCFDYDLCGTCYPNTKHADGKHKFVAEG